MSESELRDSLQRLRDEVNNLAVGDSDSRARLDALIADIEHRIEHPGDEQHHASLLETLREAKAHFEVEHPSATGILNHIMVTLSNMGI